MAKLNRYITYAKNSVKREKLTVIILAATPGKRMKGAGSKSLLLVDDNTTVLEKQIKTIYKMYTDADIIVSTGFQENKIRNLIRWSYPIRLSYNPQYEQKGVVYSIGLAMNSTVPSNLLILHGDIVFNSSAISGIMNTPFSKILVDKNPSENNDSVGVIINENKITNLSYGLPVKWGQMVYINHQDMKKFENMVFGYEDFGHMLLYEIINKMIDKGVVFMPHSPSRIKIMEIKNMEDLKRIKTI